MGKWSVSAESKHRMYRNWQVEAEDEENAKMKFIAKAGKREYKNFEINKKT